MITTAEAQSRTKKDVIQDIYCLKNFLSEFRVNPALTCTSCTVASVLCCFACASSLLMRQAGTRLTEILCAFFGSSVNANPVVRLFDITSHDKTRNKPVPLISADMLEASSVMNVM